MPPRVIKRQLTCPIEFTLGSSLIGRNDIVAIPRNHLEYYKQACVVYYSSVIDILTFQSADILSNEHFFDKILA